MTKSSRPPKSRPPKSPARAGSDRVRPPFKGHGSKWYLAPWIASHFPPRDRYLTFVDAMCRTGAVLLAHDPRDKAEVANDLDGRIMNFWQVLQHPVLFGEMQRILEATPFSEQRFYQAMADLTAVQAGDGLLRHVSVTSAVDFFVVARQSMAGRETDFAPLTRKRLRRGMNEQVSAWLSAIEGLPLVHARMRRVALRWVNVFDLVPSVADPQTFCYLDPPYHPSARSAPGVYGTHDWDDDQHVRLLKMVKESQGLFALSGYNCPLYEKELKSWNRHEKTQPVHSAGGATKRRATECLWCNY